MSVDGQVLGAATVAGGGAAGVSSLANTGDPMIIGVAVGLALVMLLGFITRAAQQR